MIPLEILENPTSQDWLKRQRGSGPKNLGLAQISNGMIRRGVTLVELMISIGILSIIVLVVGNLFIVAGQYAASEQSRIDVGESSSRVFSTLDRTVRQGKAILQSATVNGTLYTSSDTVLVFSLPSIDASGDLSPTLTDTVVIYIDSSAATNKRLRMIIDPDASSTRNAVDQDIVDHIQDAYFRYNTDTPKNADAVTMTLLVGQTILGRAFNQLNIINLTLRNHA